MSAGMGMGDDEETLPKEQRAGKDAGEERGRRHDPEDHEGLGLRWQGVGSRTKY